MYRVSGTSIMVVGLCLILGAAPSWAGGHPSGNDNSDANRNTGGGAGALVNITSGSGNTAYGSFPLFFNTTGSANTAFGGGALIDNTTGSNNTAVGAGALPRNTTGGSNTAVGSQALQLNTIGISNTGVGFGAVLSTTTGSGNTAVGVQALKDNTTGNENTAVGLTALVANTTGSGNTAVGENALFKNTTGSGNIALGPFAGFNVTSGGGNIYVGNNGGAATESNTMRLGQAQTKTFIAGVAGTAVSGSQVLVTSTGQLGILASSARYKRNIRAMGARSRGLFELRPVTFRYKQDPQRTRQYGLIAEEVAKVYPELVTRRRDGAVESVQYHELIPMLLNELQRQQRELSELKAQSARLQATLAEQTAASTTRSARLEEAKYTASLARR